MYGNLFVGFGEKEGESFDGGQMGLQTVYKNTKS